MLATRVRALTRTQKYGTAQDLADYLHEYGTAQDLADYLHEYGTARDLADYLHEHNYDRAHTGRLTQGRVPADIVYGARTTSTVR